MKNDKETKKKLLLSAHKEFLEKGYVKASLRNICRNAGVTTGALYFFFKDKEDLFASLVEEPLNKLYEVMTNHYKKELEAVKKKSIDMRREDFNEDIETSYQIIHYLYKYYDEFQLILTKSQGSRFENCVDKFVQITEKHYRILGDQMSQQLNVPKLDDCMIHWFSHMNIDTFIYILTHESSEDEAIKHMNFIIKYLTSGWIGLFSSLKKQ